MSTSKLLIDGKLVEGTGISPVTKPVHPAVFVDGLRPLVEPRDQDLATNAGTRHPVRSSMRRSLDVGRGEHQLLVDGPQCA